MTPPLRGGLVVLTLLALLGATTSCARKAVYGEATPRIETTSGRDIVIALPSDPTTGSEWRMGALPDARVAALLRSDYEPTASPTAGAAGQQVWVFRAVGAGTTTVRLDYGRPWEAPVRSATFTVIVR